MLFFIRALLLTPPLFFLVFNDEVKLKTISKTSVFLHTVQTNA
jgi:hypothetical protein